MKINMGTCVTMDREIRITPEDLDELKCLEGVLKELHSRYNPTYIVYVNGKLIESKTKERN